MSQKIPQNQNENDQGRQAMPVNPTYEEIAAARRISFSDIKNHLTGPVVSLIAHIILLAICFTFVVSAPEERKEIAVEIKELEVKNIEKLPEPPPEEKVELENVIEVEGPPLNAASVAADNTSIASSSSSTADVGVGFSDAPDVPMSNVLSIAPSSSPLVLPGVMASRSKGGIKTSLQKYNRGSIVTEQSVSKALTWLKNHQNADGSWGEPQNMSALTSLATLAFLAHGETPSSQEYGSCVLKAIKKLIEYGNTADGDGMIKNPSSNGYGHPMVAYALSEAYALTKIPMIEEAMNKTVGRIVTGQNSLGSYNYMYNNTPDKETGKPRCDLSIAGWNYQALKAAFASGCTVKGLEAAMDNSVKAIQKVHYTGAGFSYGPSSGKEGGGTPTMTSVGVLCLQLLGAGKSKEAQGGLKYIETTMNGVWMKCDWQAGRDNSLYQWYYQTQALFQGYSGSGGPWDNWNREFQKALMKEQEADGHWSSPLEKYGKSGGMEAAKKHPDKDGKMQNSTMTSADSIDLNVYSTSLCCLMLEVYYRYLPTFKVSHDAEVSPAKKSAAMDELKIE
ncbi:MAG: hypothetical protein WC637_12125 [Victivallales bacterium]|jgi:hypothetical protein